MARPRPPERGRATGGGPPRRDRAAAHPARLCRPVWFSMPARRTGPPALIRRRRTFLPSASPRYQPGGERLLAVHERSTPARPRSGHRTRRASARHPPRRLLRRADPDAAPTMVARPRAPRCRARGPTSGRRPSPRTVRAVADLGRALGPRHPPGRAAPAHLPRLRPRHRSADGRDGHRPGAQRGRSPGCCPPGRCTSRSPRADATVLTVPVASLSPLRQHLTRLVADLRPFLASQAPLLTLHVTRGVGIAECPGADASYGEHRCRLVAAAVLEHREEPLRELQRRDPGGVLEPSASTPAGPTARSTPPGSGTARGSPPDSLGSHRCRLRPALTDAG